LEYYQLHFLLEKQEIIKQVCLLFKPIMMRGPKTGRNVRSLSQHMETVVLESTNLHLSKQCLVVDHYVVLTFRAWCPRTCRVSLPFWCAELWEIKWLFQIQSPLGLRKTENKRMFIISALKLKVSKSSFTKSSE